MEWFRRRPGPKAVSAAWLEHFNHVRPHFNSGYFTLNELPAKCGNETVGFEQSAAPNAAVLEAVPQLPKQPLRKEKLELKVGPISTQEWQEEPG
jgi:hypothetical protein